MKSTVPIIVGLNYITTNYQYTCYRNWIELSYKKIPYYVFQPKFFHNYWWKIKEKHLTAIRWRDNSKLAIFNPSPGYAFVRGTATTNTPCQLNFYLELFSTFCILLYFSFYKIYTDYTDTFDPFNNQLNRLLYGEGTVSEFSSCMKWKHLLEPLIMYTYINWTVLRPHSYNYNYFIDSESDFG